MDRVPQAGAITLSLEGGRQRLLLVRPRDESRVWIFPKGHIEAGETSEVAALRELREETGVIGTVIASAGEPLEFSSGTERVSVQYHLIEATGATTATEKRKCVWVDSRVALTLLTHRDARDLLRRLLPVIDARIPSTGQRHERLDDYMLAEFGHLAESLLQNEQDGERRVAFFVSLTSAAGGGFAFIASRSPETSVLTTFGLLFGIVVPALLLLGLLTLRRVVVRNAASDAYKVRLSRVRRHFVGTVDVATRALAPFDPDAQPRRKPSRWPTIGKGGWQPTMEIVLAGLPAGAIALFPAVDGELVLALSLGIPVFVLGALGWHALAEHWQRVLWDKYAREF